MCFLESMKKFQKHKPFLKITTFPDELVLHIL